MYRASFIASGFCIELFPAKDVIHNDTKITVLVFLSHDNLWYGLNFTDSDCR